jgi:type IV pilus assembly protein PilA
MRKFLSNRKKGFTLIELMIVVAIIGILAAIAIPNFLRFQLKSKTSEGKVNLAAIRTAEESYLAEFGTYVGSTEYPVGSVTSQKQAWPASAGGFDKVGWGPEGKVFFQYAVATGGIGYTASAIANLDNNAVNQAWGYKKLNAGADVDAVHDDCPASYLTEAQVGACAANHGQSIF